VGGAAVVPDEEGRRGEKRRQLLERQRAYERVDPVPPHRAPHGVLDIPLVLGADEQHPGIIVAENPVGNRPEPLGPPRARTPSRARVNDDEPSGCRNAMILELPHHRSAGFGARIHLDLGARREGSHERSHDGEVGLDLVERGCESESPLKPIPDPHGAAIDAPSGARPERQE
jgi:hypothetical protein